MRVLFKTLSGFVDPFSYESVGGSGWVTDVADGALSKL